MRKLLMGAVIASASLVLAGAAIAQKTSPDGTTTLDASVSPKKVGTKKKPKSVSLQTVLTVNRPGTTVEVIELGLSKGLKFSGKGFKKCNIDDLIAQGPDACPSGSKAGLTGTANAIIEPGGAPLDFEVTPFVGGNTTFLFYLNGINGNGVQTAISGKIDKEGRRMRITIPLELRQPANLDATLTAIDATFKGKSGKHAIVSSTACKGGNHKITGALEFATRANGTPGPARSSLTEKVKCSK